MFLYNITRKCTGLPYRSFPSFLPPSLSPSSPGAQLLLRFLVTTSQLEQLKLEWGVKVLNCHVINTSRLAINLDTVYKDRVLRQAKKMVSKMQMRDLARKQAEEVGSVYMHGEKTVIHIQPAW